MKLRKISLFAVNKRTQRQLPPKKGISSNTKYLEQAKPMCVQFHGLLDPEDISAVMLPFFLTLLRFQGEINLHQINCFFTGRVISEVISGEKSNTKILKILLLGRLLRDFLTKLSNQTILNDYSRHL